MGGIDILRVLRKEDGLEREDLYSRVKHLVNGNSFCKNIRSLINSNDIYKIVKIKYMEGVRRVVIRFYLV